MFTRVPEISALELARAIEAGEPVQILDVRAEERVALGRIDQVPAGHFHNIRGSKLRQMNSLAETGLDPAQPVVVVCGRGNDSRTGAKHLIQLGAGARSLSGGMAGWMDLTVPRPLELPSSLDGFIQFDRIAKGALGYLLWSGDEAMVVDPPRRYEPYLDAADAAGARIVGVAETHVHADYVSGGPALAKELRVPYYVHPADLVYPYDGRKGTIQATAIADGTGIPLGRARIRVAHNPGHTEGSVTYHVDGQAALTGDFVFLQSIGRPDLAGKVAEWTGLLWQSLERARREWPGSLMVYPAHYGAESERRAHHVVGDRFDAIVKQNEAMQIRDREAFAAWIEARSTSFPESYRMIKAVNVGLERPDEGGMEELDVGRNQCAVGG